MLKLFFSIWSSTSPSWRMSNSAVLALLKALMSNDDDNEGDENALMIVGDDYDDQFTTAKLIIIPQHTYLMWTYHFMNRSPLSETFQWCCWGCFGDVLLQLWPHRQNMRWIHSLIQHPEFLASFLLLCSCGVGWVKISKGGLLAHYQLWKVIIECMGGEDVS